VKTCIQSFILTLFVVAGPINARPATADTPAMEPFYRLVGTWQGGGWIQMGPERHEFEGTETVEKKLGGRVVLIEGLHYQKSGTARREVVHHALGLIRYDEQSREYRMQSFLATGQEGDYLIEPTENGYRWTLDAHGGRKVRFTAIFEGDTWTERGEGSQDGETWQPFFEMSLRRKG
jgi:hypothetical protein